jgi:hypothetical protein
MFSAFFIFRFNIIPASTATTPVHCSKFKQTIGFFLLEKREVCLANTYVGKSDRMLWHDIYSANRGWSFISNFVTNGISLPWPVTRQTSLQITAAI